MIVTTTIDNCAIVILAAGASKRLGSPKQLLIYKGKNLLNHAVDTALETGCQNVFVVLGSKKDLLRKELLDKPVTVIENDAWDEGMASSIRASMKSILNGKLNPDSVIFMVCDQPYITSSLLKNLLKQRNETGKYIIASRYDDAMGTPAMFDKTFFPLLMKLEGDKGAGKIISDNIEHVITVPFPMGITDIDTASDYELLKRANDS